MAMYPEVQKRAQAEIDAVIGTSRLPDFSDQSSLPYVTAITKELLRWKIVVPLGLAHSNTTEDIYDGYYIPKGTVFMVNVWSILHDPAIFPDPEAFIPERFLKDGQLNVDPSILDPATVAFGFGRRICPGRHLAENSLFIIVSSVLAAFNIAAPLDADGKPVELAGDVTVGFLSYPVPFKCRITPRSVQATDLVLESGLEIY